MRTGWMLSVLAIMSTPLLARSAPIPPRPVMVAGNGDLDACLSTSQVRQLKPGAYLSVRDAPGIRAREVARIHSGQIVWSCDSAQRDQWTGIIYHPGRTGQDAIDCDLGPNDTPRRAYRGDCRSGWVATRYLINLAG